MSSFVKRFFSVWSHLSYLSHICNTLVGNWGHIIFPSLSILFPWYAPTTKKSFTLTIIKAQEKISQNTNSLSILFHGQAQAEYYLVGPAKYNSDGSIFY